MFRSLVLVFALLAVSQAGIHPYFAESNYICEMCKQHISLKNSGNLGAVAGLEALHPKLASLMEKHAITSVAACEFSVCNEYKLREEVDEEINHEAIAAEINSAPSSWVAGVNSRFNGMKRSDIKKMMGTIVDPDWRIMSPIKESEFLADVPAEFNVITNWPKCAAISGHIRDQSNCGSCWAFGTTESFNDRSCIAGKSDDSTLLSTSDTVGCCGFLACFSMGCNGGQVGTPWAWFKNTGVVTGGQQGDTGGCYDYTMPICNHHVENPKHVDCADVTQKQPKCLSSCPTTPSITYSSDKHHASSSYGLGSVADIKADLVKYGSVTAAFTVYEDFLTYKSGVYVHKSGKELGGHAVKIVGYGTESGDDYWLVNNSWNADWGNNGQFKIKQGDCGIDSQCHAGQA